MNRPTLPSLTCGDAVGHDACHGYRRKAPAIRRAFILSAPEVSTFGKPFAFAEVGDEKFARASRGVCGNTPDHITPTGSNFPIAATFADGVKKCLTGFFDSAIPGRMRNSSPITQGRSDYCSAWS